MKLITKSSKTDEKEFPVIITLDMKGNNNNDITNSCLLTITDSQLDKIKLEIEGAGTDGIAELKRPLLVNGQSADNPWVVKIKIDKSELIDVQAGDSFIMHARLHFTGSFEAAIKTTSGTWLLPVVASEQVKKVNKYLLGYVKVNISKETPAPPAKKEGDSKD